MEIMKKPGKIARLFVFYFAFHSLKTVTLLIAFSCNRDVPTVIN